MSLFGRLQMASTAFMQAWRGYTDPSEGALANDRRLAEYRLFWAYYENSVFDRAFEALWTRYKSEQRLVSYLRSIYNPAGALVDFYRAAIYPGVVSMDGKSLPDGVPSAVPVDVPDPKGEAKPDDLRAAIGQVLRWSNWQQTHADYVMYGAALGDVALEVQDHWDRSKVVLAPRYPGHIVDLELDDEGNVRYYADEYAAVERIRRGSEVVEDRYTYRKEVSRDEIRTYRDGQPYDYDGAGAVVANHYGFVPLVWVRHDSRGGERGAPAIAGSLPTLEAINHLVSILLKDVERVSRSPKVLATSSQLVKALSPEAEAALASADITLDLLKANETTSVHDLGSNLDLGACLELVTKLLEIVERRHPELTMYEKLREMSTVTGPAARRLVGDTERRVARAAANYDDGLVRACQMAVSMATIARPLWQRRTAAQEVFAPFDPTSYDRGLLDFQILPRPLVPEIASEVWSAELTRADVASKWSEVTGSKFFGLDRAGFTSDELLATMADGAELRKRAQVIALMNAERQLGEGDLDGDGQEPPEQ
jgi:hypothetical protein